MRMLRIVAAAAAALALASEASASIWPAPSPLSTTPSTGLRSVRTAHVRVTARACSAHAKAVRWLAPVACEQPPRSETLIVPLLGG